MSEVLCNCGTHKLDPNDATLVLNFVPLCSMSCLHRAETRAARDVPIGQPWTFAHRTMGEIIRIEEGENGRFRIAR